jgi:uncharacterized membrane protein YciS (DUF1049 family)
MLRFLSAAALLAAFLLAVAFAWVNDGTVRIDHLNGVVEMRLTHALFIALAVGWLLGALSGLRVLFRQRRELARRQARIARMESELDGLRRSLAAGDGR